MPELHNVPLFTFQQLDSDGCTTHDPLKVLFYNGTIDIQHVDESIAGVSISPDCFEKLVKEIRKRLPEAKRILEKRQ